MMEGEEMRGELAVVVARLSERVAALENWQKGQNHSLQRLEEQVVALAREIDRKVNQILGGLIVACILLAVNALLGLIGRG